MVFNGEIYNYRALRQELGDVPLRTSSDTEILLRRRQGGAALTPELLGNARDLGLGVRGLEPRAAARLRLVENQHAAPVATKSRLPPPPGGERQPRVQPSAARAAS